MKATLPNISILFFLSILISCSNQKQEVSYTGDEFPEMKKELSKGWNTWNTKSVLSHVLLPEKFAVDIHLYDGNSEEILEEALIGRRGENVENVVAEKRSYDGSYIEYTLFWHGIELNIKSTSVDDEIYLLIEPIKSTIKDSLFVQPYMIWDSEGNATIRSNLITYQTSTKTTEIYVINDGIRSSKNYLKVALSEPLILSTDRKIKLADIETLLHEAEEKLDSEHIKYKKTENVYQAVQNSLAWNIIYEPEHERVIMPVSRIWNCQWKGWVLFEWDTYFGAYMLSMDNKELAYANAIAMTKAITDRGFIPNFISQNSISEDRSQPPVGSFVVNQIYKQHQEKWFLYEMFEELLSWNRWWDENRVVNGYLCWGSDHYDTSETPEWLKKHVAKKIAGKWETGLDNSPMYDDVIFDEDIDKLMMADVGLISMYIWDCNNLAEIAGILNKPEVEQELLVRASKHVAKLETLWNDEFGLFLNKDMVTGEFSFRLSPTNFYPLLSKAPTQHQAERMINEHFYNPDEFWGDYVIPSIARNDPAFEEQVYWRGRIWGPMNFLVYLGLRNYDLPDARRDMAKKSEELLFQSWNTERHIYENYNAITGQGDDVESSDKFYHWGALLGFISLIENGFLPKPEEPLATL